MTSNSITFRFRVWLHPKDGDPPEIEVWYHGLEPTRKNRRFASDWALEHMSNEDLHDLFNLPDDGHFQVVGEAVLRGWYSLDGEYDEEIDILEVMSSPIPDWWFKDEHEVTND